MRVVVAKVLAVAANAVLVAQHLLKLGAQLTTALARLQMHNLARRSSLEVGSTRRKRARRVESVRNSVWQFGTGTRNAGGARACFPNGRLSCFSNLLSFELWAPCKARWVWAGALIFASATCSLQFAKASAATLSQQEKNDSADVQRGRVNISGFLGTKVS
jgi:hypothetical protein